MKNIICTLILLALFLVFPINVKAEDKNTWWKVQSIDTVKYSRDLAREKINDKSFDIEIEKQVELIAASGATHIALGTPYDEEFYSFMKRWIETSRKYDLNIWFRGNFSGWERWFDFKPITKEQHKEKLKKFISDNRDLFKDGDIFTTCVECENGGEGDPRDTGKIDEYRQFLIDEYKVAKEAFRLTGKNVATNYFPMNGDVARLIMDKQTTQALGGIVVLDHYVADSTQLGQDIKEIVEFSGGDIVIGEIGAPIPDIHGEMTEQQQAEWLKLSLLELSKIKEVVGVNYWTSFGGSTHLWNNTGQAREAAGVLTDFYSPQVLTGLVVNELDQPIKNASITTTTKEVFSDKNGLFTLPTLHFDKGITVKASGYKDRLYLLVENTGDSRLVLEKKNENLFFKLFKYIHVKLLN